MCSQLVGDHAIPEFDAFYLDMNGIIHNCAQNVISALTAPGTQVVPLTLAELENEIFLAIFHYLQVLFDHIKPKKLFFLAIDGVAPRAKLNQQRARRFRTVQEAEEEKANLREKESKALRKVKGSNWDGEIAKIAGIRFDRNCITPGTEFMQRLSQNLRYFISKRIGEDPSWREVEIILSDSNVPGEGEHKIMSHIRSQKSEPNYNPNMRHCLYGLDADLVLLGLLSHDPHFALLREEVIFGGGHGHGRNAPPKNASNQKFFLLHLCLFREYLGMEFSSFPLERVIDDFILMMCFVGNDFLPNLPSFHLGEGVLESIFNEYNALEKVPLNRNGKVDFPSVAPLLASLAQKIEGQHCRPLESTTTTMTAAKREYYITKLAIDPLHQKEEFAALLTKYCEGIQWNMTYYFEGVDSWSFFFPYHYGPYASDVAEFMLSYSHSPLIKEEPLLPLEQLMAVLPPGSSSLVPEAFRPLMLEDQSPIADFYPSTFESDSNGKKASWEAVVLIPFICSSRLRQAMSDRSSLLEPEEKKRNVNNAHSTKFAISKDRLSCIVAPPMSPFVDLENSPVIQKDFLLEQRYPFRSELCEGALVGYHSLPGFPSTSTVPVIHAGLQVGLGVCVFDKISKNPSMALNLSEWGEFSSLSWVDELFSTGGAGDVYVGYPYLREAKVVKVSDGVQVWEGGIHAAAVRVRAIEAGDELREWERYAVLLEEEYRRKMAILLQEVKVIVWVNELSGMTLGDDGSIKRRYHSTIAPYPLQTVVRKRWYPDGGGEMVDPRFIEYEAGKMPRNVLLSHFPPSSRAVWIGSSATYEKGTTFLVSGAIDPISSKIECRPFGRPFSVNLRSVGSALLKEQFGSFLAAKDLCLKAGISNVLLIKLSSSLTPFLKSELVRSADLGFGIKWEKRGVFACGVVIPLMDKFLYHPFLVDIILRLKRENPLLFSSLERLKHHREYQAEEIFSSYSKDGLLDRDLLNHLVKDWRRTVKEGLLRITGSPALTMVPIKFDDDNNESVSGLGYHPACNRLDPPSIKKLLAVQERQRVKDEAAKKNKNVGEEDGSVFIKSADLLSASTTLLRAELQNDACSMATIGDRVVITSAAGTIPFGIGGIVSGLEVDASSNGASNTKLRVVLDEKVIGGEEWFDDDDDYVGSGGIGGNSDQSSGGRGVIIDFRECIIVSEGAAEKTKKKSSAKKAISSVNAWKKVNPATKFVSPFGAAGASKNGNKETIINSNNSNNKDIKDLTKLFESATKLKVSNDNPSSSTNKNLTPSRDILSVLKSAKIISKDSSAAATAAATVKPIKPEITNKIYVRSVKLENKKKDV